MRNRYKKKLILGGKLVDEAMNSGQTNFLSCTSTGFAAFFSRLSTVFCSCFPHAHGCSDGYGRSKGNWHQADPLVLKVLHCTGDAGFH